MHSIYEARTIFRQLGAGEVSAQLATQWAHHKPITSRPPEVTSMETIRLIQKGLNSIGCTVKVSGKLDPMTALCLEDLSGAGWKDMTWLEHGKRIIKQRQTGEKLKLSGAAPVEGLGSDGGGFGSHVGALVSVLALAYFVFRK
jgi:hypothetical protein